jgi:hypothetical protein
MENYHWFLLGMMVAWTPGMVILLALLLAHPLPEVDLLEGKAKD